MNLLKSLPFLFALLALALGQVAERPTIFRLRRTSLQNNTFLNDQNTNAFRRLQNRIINSGSCNANICFALDGSGSISPREYKLQVQFAQVISAIVSVDREAAFSAVQYGLRNLEISALTQDINAFAGNLSDSELLGAERTFLAAGIGFCIQELRNGAREDEEDSEVSPTARPNLPPKIILLGDGRSNFGINPAPIASLFETFFEVGGMCAIGVGFPDVRGLREIVGGAADVFVIQTYAQLRDVIDAIVEEICQL